MGIDRCKNKGEAKKRFYKALFYVKDRNLFYGSPNRNKIDSGGIFFSTKNCLILVKITVY